MQIPSAEVIEAAADAVKKLADNVRQDELKELHSAMGASELLELGLADFSTVGLQIGYLLGLETAREVIQTSPAVLTSGIDGKEIL